MIATRFKRASWWLVLAVQFATVAAPLAVLPFLSLHLQRLSGAGTKDIALWAAAIAAAPAVGAILSTPVWAHFASSYPLGRLMGLSCLLNALSAFLQAQAGTVVLFALGRGIQGLTGIGVLLLLAVEHNRTTGRKGYSGLQQALAAGCIAGPLLGGWAFEHDALQGLLMGFGILLVALSILCGRAFHDAGLVEDDTRSPALNGRLPPTASRTLVLSGLLATAGAFGFMPFFADWALERESAVLTASLVGLLHAGSWAAAFVVLPLWGRWIDAGRERAVMRLSTAGSLVALLSLLAGSTIVSISLSRIVHGAFNAGLAPSLFSSLGRSRHRVLNLAAGRTAITLGQVIGPAICGLAVFAAGNDGALLAAALLTLLASILLYLQPEARRHDVE
ncbi:MFS transporter [Agrobacterium sp. NPDC090283]|uniref:MFS transporter n=1 Tax=Agrobacterium sp. NPDC090283 TaxID=3363920 RepID=UPI00383BAA59